MNIARTTKNKNSATGIIFVSPSDFMYLPRPIQQFLYLVLEAAYGKLEFLHCSPHPESQHNDMAPV